MAERSDVVGHVLVPSTVEGTMSHPEVGLGPGDGGAVTRRSVMSRAAGAVAAAGAAAIAACGPAGSPAPATAGQRAPVTIRHLARAGEAYLRLQRELRDMFQARYPHITVEVDDTPGDWYQKFVTQTAVLIVH